MATDLTAASEALNDGERVRTDSIVSALERFLDQAQSLASDLIVMTKTLSYVKAEELRAVLTKSALTPLETAQTDDQTSTLISSEPVRTPMVAFDPVTTLEVVIVPSPSSPNPGTPVSFNSHGTTYFAGSGPGVFPANGFEWTFGDGASCSTALANCVPNDRNPQHAYGAVGTYSVGLQVTDSKLRTGRASAIVTVVASTAPVAAFTFSASSIVAPAIVNFDASSSLTPSGAAIAAYRWDFGDGTTAVTVASATTKHIYANAGSFVVTLTVTDTIQISSTSEMVTITA
jgi:hypothetical protein